MSEVTSHLCLCLDHPIEIAPPVVRLLSMPLRLVAPTGRFQGLFILRAVPGTVSLQADQWQVALPLVPGGAHSLNVMEGVAAEWRRCNDLFVIVGREIRRRGM